MTTNTANPLVSPTELSPTKKALLALKQMQSKLDAIELAKTEPIAIIGMGCRFPGGADTPEQFWTLLHEGISAAAEVPADRWPLDAYYDSNMKQPARAKMYVRRGHFLSQVDQFDPQFFGISPREAVMMDPQQRLLLEVCWETLERAALAPANLVDSNTGVFVGIMNQDYLHIAAHPLQISDMYTATGSLLSVAAGRLAYILGLQGPALTVDTACSSSLVTVHLAAMSLRLGECDLALAGGVNLMVAPHSTVFSCLDHSLAPDGRSKTFDAAADGYGRGEGCGMVALKRLSDAMRDGDNIVALIRGSAVNHDGKSSGLTVPNGIAQQKVIRQALKNSKVNATDVSYIEAHGTGTSLGDPIEVESLAAVFGPREQPLLMGSVKTNIGHLESGAGIAGLFKVVLALQHQEIPPHLHLETPNPLIPWDEISIAVPTSPCPFPQVNGRRLAGVSSFAISGTNAHVILEEAPNQYQPTFAPEEPLVTEHLLGSSQHPLHLLTLSAKSENALRELTNRYETYLNANPDVSVADICFTANTGRSHFAQRLAVLGESTIALGEALQTARTRWNHASSSAESDPKIAFLFTGQGSQYVNMGRRLFETAPTFHQALVHCDEILRKSGSFPKNISLLDVLYPATAPSSASALLNNTEITQPALFAVAYGLAKLWNSWGISPDYVCGHSVGEYVAACIAGVFSLEEGLQLIAERGRLMGLLPRNGAMVAIAASEEQVAYELQPYANVAIAAINGPQSVVISGDRQAVDRIVARFVQREIQTTQLPVSHAFHSPLMEPMVAAFRGVADTVTYSEPIIDLVSLVTGNVVTPADRITSAEYWSHHILAPVRFEHGMQCLYQQGVDTFVEIGPKPVLLGMARQGLSDDGSSAAASRLWLPTLRPLPSTEGEGDTFADDWQHILKSLGDLYVRGAEVDWAAFHANQGAQKVILPTYPFQRERYWVQSGNQHVGERGNGQHEGIVTHQRSNVMNLLAQGDAGQLAARLGRAGQFTPEQQTFLSSALALLINEHQQEQLSAQLDGADWFYEPVWRPQPRIEAGATTFVTKETELGRWLIFADRGGVGEALAEHLAQQGQRPLLVYATHGESYQEGDHWYLNPAHLADFQRVVESLMHEQPINQIVYLWGVDIPEAGAQDDGAALLQNSVQSCGGVLHLLQAITAQTDLLKGRVWLVTRGAISIQDEPVAVGQTPLWGLGKVISLEHPQIWGGMLDLSLRYASLRSRNDAVPKLAKGAYPEDAQLIYTEIVDQLGAQQKEDAIAFRGEERYIARLVSSARFGATSPNTVSSPPLAADATYLITGGLGALGLSIAQWMVERGAKHLLLTGRSGAKGKEEQVQQLTQSGATIKVVAADVANADDVTKLLAEAQKTMPPLRGIVHTAGVLDDGVLQGQSWERFEQVMRPKVAGAWNLHTLTAEIPLDFFVLFSSEASLLGSAGQANYAAGNAFLDGLAHYRRALGLPALSINWGSWDEVGMATQVSEQQHARWRAQGIQLIPPKVGLSLLGRLLVMDGQVAVLPIDWSLFRKTTPNRTLLADLGTVTPKEVAKKETPVDDFALRLQEAPINNRLPLLMAHLQAEVAQILGARQLPTPTQGLFDMGMDSLLAMELRNHLQSTLQIAAPATLVLEHPTIEKLANHLLKELFVVEAPEKAIIQTEATQESQRDKSMRAAIEQLSTEDLLAQLASELADY